MPGMSRSWAPGMASAVFLAKFVRKDEAASGMTITANPSVRQVLATVVQDPEYPAVAAKPVLSWPTSASCPIPAGQRRCTPDDVALAGGTIVGVGGQVVAGGGGTGVGCDTFWAYELRTGEPGTRQPFAEPAIYVNPGAANPA